MKKKRGSQTRKKGNNILNYLTGIMLFQVLLTFFGIYLVINPYTFVPVYSVTSISIAGDPSGQPSTLIFKISSKGLLTANYPIDVNIKFYIGSDWKEEMNNARLIDIHIIDSYQYPIIESELGGIPGGTIKISKTTPFEGKGKLLFPYEGDYSSYIIFLNESPFYFANFQTSQESTIFKVQDYSARISIENNNKNLGLTIMSISLTIFGLLYAYRKDLQTVRMLSTKH